MEVMESVTSLMRYVRRPQARLACAFYILFTWLSRNMSHVVVTVRVAHASSFPSIVSPLSRTVRQSVSSVATIGARLDVRWSMHNTWVATCCMLRLPVAFMRHALMNAMMMEILAVMRHHITVV